MSNTHSLEINEANGSYASAPHLAAYNVSNITVECWCYRFSTDVFNKQRGLIDKGRDGYGGWSLALEGNASEPQKVVFKTKLSGANRSVTSSVNYPKDEWFHVAGTYNGSAIKVFLNGAEVGSASFSGTLGTTSIAIFLGRFNDGANGSIDCLIDEPRIWNYARTQSEIDTNKSVELTGSESGLLLYSKLNNTYADETSNANDFSPTNSPTFSTSVPFVGGGGGGVIRANQLKPFARL